MKLTFDNQRGATRHCRRSGRRYEKKIREPRTGPTSAEQCLTIVTSAFLISFLVIAFLAPLAALLIAAFH